MAQRNQKISELRQLTYYAGSEIIPLAYNNKNYSISIDDMLRPLNEKIDEIGAESGSGTAFKELSYQVEQMSYELTATYATAISAYAAANTAYTVANNAYELVDTAYTLADSAYTYATTIGYYNEQLKTYTYFNVGMLWAKTSYIETYMISGGGDISQEWITTTNNRLDNLESKMSAFDAVTINPDGTVDPDVIRNNPLAYAISTYSIGKSIEYTDRVSFEDIQEL